MLTQRGQGLMAGLANTIEDLLGQGYSAVVLADADKPDSANRPLPRCFRGTGG